MKINGIDVSEWQETINWSSVKSQISFVILREGYRRTTDKYFFKNIDGCRINQIPIHGIYHFIYALNKNDVIAEAESCLKNIQKAGLPKSTYIWADFEYDTVSNAAKKGVNLGPNECNLFTQTFCEFFKEKGYNTGIYTNGDYYKNWYRQDVLNKYPLWLADYTGDPDYPCLYQQYTSSGQITGIKGKVDMNYYFGAANNNESTSYKKTDAINRVISIASAEIGYLEKKSNSQLDDKTANAGSNNFTKYWRDVKPEWNGQAWCAIFVSWVLMRAFDKTTATKLLKHWPYVYCPTLGSLFTQYANPEVGDIVIFYRGGTFAHTGIVTAVNGDRFTTIEGNTSGASGVIANGGGVCQKSYYNSSLPGTKFCRPDWDLAVNWMNTNLEGGNPDGRDYLQKGDHCAAVKAMQENLIYLGYDLGKSGADGDFGDDTLKALKQAQSDLGLAVDGYYGPNTRTAVEAAIEAKRNPQKGFLSEGDTGDSVKILQKNLITLGYNCGKSGCDGDFGPGTTKAVKEFQDDHGLEVDGCVGTKTQEKISTAILIINHTQNGFTVFTGEVQKTCVVHKSAKKASQAISGWPKLVKGNLVDVLGRDGYHNTWYKICIAGKYTGYVWADSIKATDATAYKNANADKGFIVYTGKILRASAVHLDPKKSSPAITGWPKLVKGNLVDVIGKGGYQNRWSKVCIANQFIGYAWSDNIQKM
jgi:GH25 family lysozyme M1 (1,4-beta-N-acetylmuramidase)/peptidoglycan hydrolase-like protein with peptidoglycan-binding domain